MRIIIFLLFLSSTAFQAQNYQFSEDINIACTPVISQGRTGTCWSFSTSSFLESEIIRLKGKPIDLSEMYTVRQIYPEKANTIKVNKIICRITNDKIVTSLVYRYTS